MKVLAQHYIYINYMCAKFQGQKIHTEKDTRNLPTSIAMRKISLLPTFTPFQGMKNCFFAMEILA